MKKRTTGLFSSFILMATLWSLSFIVVADSSATRLTTGTSVRLRSEPRISAKEVMKLPLGTLVTELEKNPQRVTVGGKKDFWYRVTTSDNKEGWLFGGFSTAFSPDKAADIYLKVAMAQFNAKKPGFTDLVELWFFLNRTSADVTPGEKVAELKLLRLQVLQRSLRVIPYDKEEKPPYKEWLRQHQPEIGYNEVGGSWLVKPEQFWNLHKQYAQLPIGERIAWEAANQPLGGECEGYVPCDLSRLNSTTGKYLNLYPRGKYVTTALNQMLDLFNSLISNRNNLLMPESHDKEALAELQKEHTQLQKILEKVNDSKKTVVLKTLDQLITSKPQN